MRRVRVLLLLLLLPAQAASLWALPSCSAVAVCPMAQDGDSSCCSNASCSMETDSSAASPGNLIVFPAVLEDRPDAAVRPPLCSRLLPAAGARASNPDGEIPDPPPRG